MSAGSVSWERRDDVPWVVLDGEIDVAVAERVGERELEELRTPDELVVDLTGVTFMDSVGLAMLLRFRQVAQRVRLVAVPGTIAHLLDLTGVTELFDHDTVGT